MKTKNIFFFSVVLLLCIAALWGIYSLYNDVFPLAPPIFCPAEEVIDSVSIMTDAKEQIELESSEMEALLLGIRQAEATRKQSLDDAPSARPYYRISLKSNGIEYRYFVYQRIDQVYIEIPYSGVYLANEEILSILQK